MQWYLAPHGAQSLPPAASPDIHIDVLYYHNSNIFGIWSLYKVMQDSYHQQSLGALDFSEDFQATRNLASEAGATCPRHTVYATRPKMRVWFIWKSAMVVTCFVLRPAVPHAGIPLPSFLVFCDVCDPSAVLGGGDDCQQLTPDIHWSTGLTPQMTGLCHPKTFSTYSTLDAETYFSPGHISFSCTGDPT